MTILCCTYSTQCCFTLFHTVSNNNSDGLTYSVNVAVDDDCNNLLDAQQQWTNDGDDTPGYYYYYFRDASIYKYVCRDRDSQFQMLFLYLLLLILTLFIRERHKIDSMSKLKNIHVCLQQNGNLYSDVFYIPLMQVYSRFLVE